MGSISQRKSVSGAIRYRAEIRAASGFLEYKESKTRHYAYSNKLINKREQEIENNPDILLGVNNKSMSIADAIKKYKRMRWEANLVVLLETGP